METPGEFDNKETQKCITDVIIAANLPGKPSGIISGKTSFLQKYQAKGISVLSWNSEVGMILNGAKKIVKEFEV